MKFHHKLDLLLEAACEIFIARIIKRNPPIYLVIYMAFSKRYKSITLTILSYYYSLITT